MFDQNSKTYHSVIYRTFDMRGVGVILCDKPNMPVYRLCNSSHNSAPLFWNNMDYFVDYRYCYVSSKHTHMYILRI